MKIILLVFTYFSVHLVLGVPDLPYEHGIKLNSASQNQHALQKGSEIVNQSTDKGKKEEIANEGFDQNEDKKYEKSETDGHYNNQEHVKKLDEKDEKFENENFHNTQGGNLAGVEKKTGHKKGHHKSGYHNSYHKDEKGGNSSFYDDAHDEADERFLKKQQGYYGDAGHNSNHGAHVNDQGYLKDSRQSGLYDQGKNYNLQHGDSKKYHQNQYYDDRDLYKHNNMGKRYDEKALSAIEQDRRYQPRYDDYYGYRPQYQQVKPIYEPSRESKITIYEDPRYGVDDRFHNGYIDDRIDYRPNRYYNNYRNYRPGMRYY